MMLTIDFETYSEAGYLWRGDTNKWVSAARNKPGIAAVGSWVYAEHPSTEVLCLDYNGTLWAPGMPPPADLFAHIAAGGLIEAHNSLFEYAVWLHVCHRRMGWPELPLGQLRCTASRSRAWSLPAALGKAGEVLNLDVTKDKIGKSLINKLSIPKNPLKKHVGMADLPHVNRPTRLSDPELYRDMEKYCAQDVRAERSLSAALPELQPAELSVWLTDQRINARGVCIDQGGLNACITIAEQAAARYTAEVQEITGGVVRTADELQKITGWLGGRGLVFQSIDAESVENTLNRDDIPADCRRVLEIRASLGSRSVKKLYAIRRMLGGDGRIHGLFAYCGADTGRWAGRGPQPQNLPRTGPPVKRCTCNRVFWAALPHCPLCLAPAGVAEDIEWGKDAVSQAMTDISTGRLSVVETLWGDAISTICGCLRGLFAAAPGHDLLCSDYSAIEAVVIAAIAGEEWRLDVFRTHGKIYEQSASQITGIPFDTFIEHKKNTGKHLPERSSIGKVAELASGFQGSVGAWKAFGADKYFTDEEILGHVRAWRKASPMIVKLWYGLEDAACNAVRSPGNIFTYRGIGYGVKGDVLYCRLPSGRLLSYHRPVLQPGRTPWGREVWKLTFEGWNSDYKKGPLGWMRMETYGGKLTENVVQAAARDIMAYSAIQGAEAAGYPAVLHVHDEIVTEVPEGYGSVGELEAIMARVPSWADGWPIKAAGGWRGKRYRK